jgi:WD40 repeat protein
MDCSAAVRATRESSHALQVKLWTVSSGFCYVTFSEHTAPVTAVGFLPTLSAAVSASMDGTVRAWDLLRYRNFRTMTTPTPVQFASLAVDPAGEVRSSVLLSRHLAYPGPPPA